MAGRWRKPARRQADAADAVPQVRDRGPDRGYLPIPDHLPSGSYELQAIGDETLNMPLAITAVAGGAVASPGGNAANETLVPRDRAPIELAVIVGIAVLAALLGGFIAWRAERFRGIPSA